MKREPAKTIRCAIYTRVSSDSGLEQDFNSLDAQYEASQAYIKSQAHAGWTLIRSRYDDGGFSGGSTERPALQRLLDDIRAKKVDVIVVYKVDRLTRSLADFAKLVELFDAHAVSFVSVTQQFNTTTSMGRLTLNVLLSFAQFEREVTSERIRDKIAASKRKGLWVGGNVPLGYAAVDKKIVVLPDEAEVVRTIFKAYDKLGSLDKVMAALREQGMTTKRKTLKTGRTIGGIPFNRGPLAYLLRNRFYIGEVVYKGEILKGEQEPILDRSLFDRVQEKLSDQRVAKAGLRSGTHALLMGLIVDDRGNVMTPTHTVKKGVRYRYYISTPLLHGQAAIVGSVHRVPAVEVEDFVLKALRKHTGTTQDNDRDVVRTDIEGVQINSDRVVVTLKGGQEGPPNQQAEGNKGQSVQTSVVEIPWVKPPSKKKREIILPSSVSRDDIKPIRAEDRMKILAGIAKGKRWLDEIISGQVKDIDEIAKRERCSVRKVNMTISLAFLAPSLVKAAIEGRLPRGVNVSRLYDVPPEWHRQYKALGLQTSLLHST
jgi:site-specific DNA recombinase